jgi:hypothetical protein
MATPKLLEAACKGTHLSQGGPDDDGSDDSFVYGGPENADGRGYTAGHFALELEGHNASPTVDYGTGSFIIANVGDPATIDASLVFDSTGGDRSTVLPYIEERATMMKMFMGDYGNSTGASINIQDVILRHGSDATVTDTFDFKGEVTALEPVWTTDGSSTGDTADLWEWRKQVMDGTLKDTFDFQPQLTSEPTAAEAGHVKVFSQVDFNATPHGPYDTFNFKPELTSEPTTSGDQLFDNDGFFVFNRSNQGPADEGPEETVAFYYTKIPDQTFDDLAVDPTNPNTGHTPEWSNLRSGDPGLPAVQKDDAFDFTTEPTEPTATEAYPIKEGLFVFNRSDQVYGNTGDGGIIIEWTTGDGPKGGDTVGVIAIITPTEHGSSILEFSVENFSAFPQPENNAVSGDGGTKSDGQDDGWCMATEIDFPESVHALYDLVV